MPKIVKSDLNIRGMEIASMIKHQWTLWRTPFVDFDDEPKIRNLIGLLWRHSAGRLMVKLETRHPGIYRFYVRAGNSVVFRSKRYLRLIRRKLSK